MRQRAKRDGITIKAYAGTTGILLAFNVTETRRRGLLGFAIHREGGGAADRWLRGVLRFPGVAADPDSPVDSNEAPIQKFRWSDYSVYPDSRYTYAVHGVYGRPGALRLVEGGSVDVRTHSLLAGRHRVIFNRAVAASQAYSRRFPGANPDHPINESARRWLSRGLHEALLEFIRRGMAPGMAIDVAIYEMELPEVVQILRAAVRAGAEVRVVYHSKTSDEQTVINEAHLSGLPIEMKRPRKTSRIFHQKFAVLSRMNSAGNRFPISVLTGSTNFTSNGVYRQANVLHVVEDEAIAQQYEDLFDQLFTERLDVRNTKRWINDNNPVLTDVAESVVFSPRTGGAELAEIARVIDGASNDVIFCTAFKLEDTVQQALRGSESSELVRYGLQNRKSTITGVHRFGEFVVPTFLRGGLEGFLRESFAGQRGSIFVHLKAVVVDFTTDSPVVFTGSHNLSTAGSEKNDENMLIIRGNTDAADVYGVEMMRFYDHYRFRHNRRARSGRGTERRLRLADHDGWTDRYFETDSLRSFERKRFSS